MIAHHEAHLVLFDCTPVVMPGSGGCTYCPFKAHRRRLKYGVRRLKVDLDNAQLDELEKRGYLDSKLRGERADEAEALETFLMEALAKSG